VLYRQQLNDDNVIRAWTEIVPSFIGRVQVDDNLLTIFLHFDLRVVLRRLRCLRTIVSLSFFLGTHKRIFAPFFTFNHSPYNCITLVFPRHSQTLSIIHQMMGNMR